MNLEKLKQAEADFFERFPGGFDNPELIQIRKKHHLSRMFELTQESFAEKNFNNTELIAASVVKVITRSSLISVFEKTKYRNFADSLPAGKGQLLSDGLREFLHGNERHGFEAMLQVLQRGGLAKWSLLTICPAYFHPREAVFVKPSTTKRIIKYFELDHLQYYPIPTWTFYTQYRTTLNEMKAVVDPSLSPYNIAFTGFLMRSMPDPYTYKRRSHA